MYYYACATAGSGFFSQEKYKDGKNVLSLLCVYFPEKKPIETKGI